MPFGDELVRCGSALSKFSVIAQMTVPFTSLGSSLIIMVGQHLTHDPCDDSAAENAEGLDARG